MLRSLLLALLLCAAIAFADLRDPNNRADYMIVTTDALILSHPWISELALWRGEHGRVPVVVPVEDVWNEFGNGTPSDTALKTFLHFARLNWQPPQLKDVFIVGFHDIVPSHLDADSEQMFQDSNWTVYPYLSDLFYATDPESANYFPILNIGRFPWSPTQMTELPNYFAKIQSYELAAADSWQRRVHLIADSAGANFDFARNFSEPLANLIPADFTIERDYLDYPVGHEWHGDRDEVLANLQAGSFLETYNGHGGENLWSTYLHLDSTDFSGLTNGVRLPVVTTSTVPWITDMTPGSLVRSLLFNPNGGAIACIGTSCVSWAFAGHLFEETLYQNTFSDSALTFGDVWRRTEVEYIQTYPIQHVPLSPTRMTAFSTMLLGDPGLRLPSRASSVDLMTAAPPSDIQLYPGYPNPFNSSTRITYRLNRSTEIQITVYDMLGREVSRLVRGFQAAGEHTVMFNALDQASGLYFVLLQSHEVKQVQKIILMK